MKFEATKKMVWRYKARLSIAHAGITSDESTKIFPRKNGMDHAEKLYFFLALHSTKDGQAQYRSGANFINPGMNTVFSLSSTAMIHLFATASRFKPCSFGLSSRTVPPSTAEARKSPSTVEGRTKEKEMDGCSIERAW